MLLSLLALCGCALLVILALREQRRATGARRRLLDEAGRVLANTSMRLAADDHPIVEGLTGDGSRVTLDLVSDTMVTRRLPQLWLRVTLHNGAPQPWPRIGVLARPTGAEYYAAVHGLDHWLDPPASTVPMLMRGDADAEIARWFDLRIAMAALVSDTAIKEVLVLPGAVRITLQAAEGERSSHVLLRQARFAIDTVPAETIAHGLAVAERLRDIAENAAALALFEDRKTA